METPRLRLVPFDPRHLLALIESEDSFESLSGLRPAEGLRVFFVGVDVSPAWLESLRASTDADAWKHGLAVVLRESNSVIGTVGFKGPPSDNGVVEIAYGIVPKYQSQGYATEATEAGIRFAFADKRVQVARAHTLDTNLASIRVVSKCGFVSLGEVIDPDDGPVIRWELRRTEIMN